MMLVMKASTALHLVSHSVGLVRSSVRLGLSLVCVGVVALQLNVATSQAASTPAAVARRPQPPIFGTWVWFPKYVSETSDQDQLLAFATRQKLNRLLVQIPWAHGSAQVIRPMAAEVTDGQALHPAFADPAGYTRLVTEAAKRHISIEALDGTPTMGDAAHRAETLATVDAIVAFNRALPQNAKLAGIHWDIEPYTREEWKDSAQRTRIEEDYLQTLVEARQKLQDAGGHLTLSVDIPMWYDNKTEPGDNCIVTFNGQTKNFHKHIQDIADYVGIMSYRQHALGRNSTMEMIANELAYAEQIGKFVCPAFETIKLEDTPQITFFGKPAATLLAEKQKLQDELKNRPGYGGMFIHHYDSLRAVLEPDGASAAK